MERSDYTIGQKVVHWLMAIVIILDLNTAQKFGRVMEDWDRLESRADHATLGTIVAILFVLRLFLRYRHGAPPLPAGMPSWQLRAAKAGHWLLYFFIGFLILSGLLTASNAASPILIFQSLDITVGRTDETVFQFLRQFHEFATNAVIALIVAHFIAALHHHFVSKDDSTKRMLRFWKSS